MTCEITIQEVPQVFDCESDLFDRVLDRVIGAAKGAALPAETDDGDSCDFSAPALISMDPGGALTDYVAREGYTSAHCWAVLPSRKVPRWLLPLGNRKATISGTQIYEPQAHTSRIFKNLLIHTIRMGWSAWARDKVLIASKKPLLLETLVKEVTGEPNPVFALLVGNQRATRKLTVQAMRPNGEILGYLKLPLTDAANERVRHEADTLERLWAVPALRPHIPHLLYAGHCNDIFVLFQSAVGGKHGPIHLEGIHENFLQNLGSVHRVEKPGTMLVEEVAAQWVNSAPQRESAWQGLGDEVLRRSARGLSQVMIPYGVMHGDFAPWNTRVHHGRLFLFDWESAVWQAPLSWDKFHFEVQTACFLKKGRRSAALPRPKPGDQALYLLYVLSSVSQLIAEGADPAGINYRRRLLTGFLSGEPIWKHALSRKKEPFDPIGVAQS